MTRSQDALVTAEILVWARESAGLSGELAAERLGVTEDRLKDWESGKLKPTVLQVRKLASVYRQSFSAFYLPNAPEVFKPPLHDFRRLPGGTLEGLSSYLIQDIRLAMDRRAVLLELGDDFGDGASLKQFHPTLRRDPEALGEEIRNFLGVGLSLQQSWSDGDGRIAFNGWREAIEARQILVFQSIEVDLDEMRGYSVADFPLPVIVVNRKDTYTGRTFSMLHELVHVLLRSSGVCDLDVRADRPPEDQKVEVFCNHAAGATLVPKPNLLRNPFVKVHDGMEWSDEELHNLAKQFSVSREVVLRRLLILGQTSQDFYEHKRAQYLEQYRQRTRAGFVPPPTNVVSAAGKPFVRRVLSAFYGDRITTSDVSDYLGIRLKHLSAISQAVGLE